MSKLDKKDLIIEAAEKLFADVGYDSTSVRDICQVANVNVAMVNYYFGSKDGLLKEMIERKSAVMRGRLEALLQDSTLSNHDKMKLAIANMLDRMFMHRPFTLNVIREMTKLNQPEMRKMILALFLPNLKLLKELIRAGIKKKEFRKVDIEFTIASITGTCWHVISAGDLIIPRLEGKEEDMDVSELRERLQEHLYQFIQHHLVIA